MRRLALGLAAVFVSVSIAPSSGADDASGGVALKQSLDKLRVVGSTLMIAAHPDDENTAFLAHSAKGLKLRTGYLSLTRGEGGQNLIGTEQGALLGVLRTQEMLAARRIDGAEQFFTRAIDFGYSKTADEALAKWGREAVLSDVVYVIRKFRPDVIVLRFSGTPEDGHGQHQAAGLLGKEAFRAAADPARFPEQLKRVQPWQARRLVWNPYVANPEEDEKRRNLPGRFVQDPGAYDPLLGASYREIAGASRSLHRSQSMGQPQPKGSSPDSFFVVDGEPAVRGVMDGIDSTWTRLPGGAPIDTLLAQAQKSFSLADPSAVIPYLVQARPLLAAIDHPDARLKLRELDDTIAQAAGLWVELSAPQPSASPGSTVELQLTALNRSPVPATLLSCTTVGGPQLVSHPKPLADNKPSTWVIPWQIPVNHPYTQPLWLQAPPSDTLYHLPATADVGKAEGEPVLTARCEVRIADAVLTLLRPLTHRYVDRARGELVRPFAVLPPVTLQLSETALIFPNPKARTITVEARAHRDAVRGEIGLRAPAGWQVQPASQTFQLAETDQQVALSFAVTPPATPGTAQVEARAQVDGREISLNWALIAYDHIPVQSALSSAQATVVREDVRVAARRIGYIMGAGDTIPDTLPQLGCDVTLLSDKDLGSADLDRFETIVTGVRAWNVRPELRASHARLFDYVQRGGTLVVQYNVKDGLTYSSAAGTLKNMAPVPTTIGSGRVSVEEAPVKFLVPEHPVFRFPNPISRLDFDGWVQERGLYFPDTWDPSLQALIETGDPDEKPLRSGILTMRHGKGNYVFTSLSFFRQLPAGVPGAVKLFANLISAGKTP